MGENMVAQAIERATKVISDVVCIVLMAKGFYVLVREIDEAMYVLVLLITVVPIDVDVFIDVVLLVYFDEKIVSFLKVFEDHGSNVIIGEKNVALLHSLEVVVAN